MQEKIRDSNPRKPREIRRPKSEIPMGTGELLAGRRGRRTQGVCMRRKKTLKRFSRASGGFPTSMNRGVNERGRGGEQDEI